MKWVDRRNKDGNKRRGGVMKGGSRSGSVAKKIPYNPMPARPVEQAKPYVGRDALLVGQSYRVEITGLTDRGNAIAYYGGNRIIVRTNGSKVSRRDLVEIKIAEKGFSYTADLVQVLMPSYDERMRMPRY